MIRTALLVAQKDITSELRSRDLVLILPVFPLLIQLVVHFTLDLSQAPALAPGIFWIAFSFAGLLAMRHSFFNEQDRNSLDGLLLLPVLREALYLGKMLAGLAFMLAVEVVMVPIFAVMLGVSVLHWQLPLIFFLATLGFATTGGLLSALMAHDRARELMLPMFFLPSVLPIVIGAVKSTTAVMQHAGAGGAMGFLVICAAVYLAICTWLSGHLFEE